MPVFFVVIKLTRHVAPILVWTAAAALEMTHAATGWAVIDEYCARLVYVYSGYLFGAHMFALSDRARTCAVLALAGLALEAAE